MAGWIKVEKDLPGSFRFKRLLNRWRETRNALVTRDERDVTLLVGAVTRFWMYVDSHIRPDNTCNGTFAEINELVGVPLFAESMPEEWLIERTDDCVEVPGFYEKNGSYDSRKTSNAERQRRFRERQKQLAAGSQEGGSNASVTLRNTSRQTDQTRPDRPERKTRAREDGSDRNASERNGNPDRDLPYELTQRIQAIYPPGTYGAANWILAEREISKLLDTGEDPEQLVELTRAFRAQMDAKKSTGTQFVRSPENHFGADGHWRGPFPIPKTTTEVAADNNRAELLRRMRTGTEP